MLIKASLKILERIKEDFLKKEKRMKIVKLKVS